MSLTFSPLYWTYHDSWKFQETHHLVEADSNGDKKIVDKSKYFYQRGHCHLCMPDISPDPKANSRAYSGEQVYNMHIQDEWGPNSSDPNQSQSVSLIGKPIWYLYVEEYWRRVYIQPWDKEDESCTLPCNQSKTYEKRDPEDYVMSLISEYDATHSTTTTSGETVNTMQEKYFDYLSDQREKAALEIYITSDSSRSSKYATYYKSQQTYQTDDVQYTLKYMRQFILLEDTEGDTLESDFQKFYLDNSEQYDGYVDSDDIALQFAEEIAGTTSYDSSTRKKFDLSDVNRDTSGSLLIELYSVGHTGIKYDASKACHSLGPFREGGNFYFFNTVVNRTMPVEYWIDEDKKTRQYYLKEKNGDSDDSTKGGQTWTFDGDYSHFIYVYDLFSEAEQLVEDYNSDEMTVHRLRPKDRYYSWSWAGFNAKRLKTDHHIAYREDDELSSVTWYGENSKIVESGKNLDGTDIEWENRYWTGWYELNEIVKAVDGNWYIRIWSPPRYDVSALGMEDDAQMPYWTMQKRRMFPNPPPWICDGSESSKLLHGQTGVSASSFSESSTPYEDSESNRMHCLHYEYMHYYDKTYYTQRYSNPSRKYIFSFPGGKTTTYEGMTGEFDVSTIVMYDTTYGVIASSRNYIQEGYELTVVPLYWDKYLEDEIIKSHGIDPYKNLKEEVDENWSQEMQAVAFDEDLFDISDESMAFSAFISTLDYDYATRYSDGYADVYDSEGNACGKEYRVWYEGNPRLDGISDDQTYTKPDAFSSSGVNLTYISFDDFRKIWRPLSEDEIDALNLNGDYPVRNTTPYPVEDSTQYSVSSTTGVYAQQEQMTKLVENESKTLDESSPDLLKSEFDPKIDVFTHQENLSRRYSKSTPKPPQLPLNPDDTTSSSEPYEPIDPYDSGDVNPFDVWKKYFSHREAYTIPHKTTVRGDYTIEQEGKNFPIPHPREMSFSNEDGARRYYPDDRFVSPIIEYQRIIHLNYERLPGKEAEESYIQSNWKTAQNPEWGDGFDMSISIPYKKGDEIQSPFSESNNSPTQPIGEYFHDVIKPENKMRYHIEFYDSLEQIRRYDFPGYVDFIRGFQMEHLDEDFDKNGKEYSEIYAASSYQENFNDEYDEVVKWRESTDSDVESSETDENGSYKKKKWSEVLEEYWNEQDSIHHYSLNPVVRNRSYDGKDTQEESFVTLNDGTTMWREKTTYMLPELDKVPHIVTSDNPSFPGYLDSEGNPVKGGKIVEWNNPYESLTDGRWVEQCLGAIVKTKVMLILEDRLGYRWKQYVEDTAMQSTQSIQGKDHDAS